MTAHNARDYGNRALRTKGATMRIFRMTQLKLTPWRNGGGVTREIAAARTGEDLVWRLSMADVDVDGPFSNFSGLTRILTVIDGDGMDLVSPERTLQANLGQPVQFDGGLKIDARLRGGPIRDFNLVFDPLLCRGQVDPLMGPHRRDLRASPQCIHAVHNLHGAIEFDPTSGLHSGDTALIENEHAVLNLMDGATALLVTLAFPSQVDASKAATAER